MTKKTVVNEIKNILGPSVDSVGKNKKGNILLRRSILIQDHMTCDKFKAGVQMLLSSNGIHTEVISSKKNHTPSLGDHYVVELNAVTPKT
jgi:hypothetical protein